MASVVYNEFKRASAAAEIDLDTAGDDIRMALCMTNTTCDTQNDGMINVNDFTDIDEHATAGRKALANEAVNKDDANDRAEFDADDVTYTALAAGARASQGVLVYKHVTNDTDAVVIAWVEFSANQTHSGSDFTIAWNAEGILQLT